MNCHDEEKNSHKFSTKKTVVIVGNPNTGKTTLFNQLTGSNQKIANYPGVTVEKKSGILKLNPQLEIELIDLPGTYSLTARSPEEKIAHDVLLGLKKFPQPDLALCVLDACSLERNLYLCFQIMELGVPLLIVLNMIDEAEKQKLKIQTQTLSELLHCPLVPIVACERKGLDFLKSKIIELLDPKLELVTQRPWKLDQKIEKELDPLKELLQKHECIKAKNTDGEALWLLMALNENSEEILDLDPKLLEIGKKTLEIINEKELDFSGKVIETRYALIKNIVEKTCQRPEKQETTITEKIDNILTHRILGPILLLAIFTLMFQLIFTWADPFIASLEKGLAMLTQALNHNLPEGILREFIVGGLIGGVGNVIVFVPQIAFLFAFLALLEETGYIARAAFILDRVMSSIGLHGKAFIPLLSCHACAVPGIMATRTIENKKDRLITILVSPLITCSARLPVYTLIIAALLPSEIKVFNFFSLGAIVFFALYFLGTASALIVAFIFKKTLLKSPKPPLVLELPPYRIPNFKNVFLRAYTSSKIFLKDAGSIILISSLVLWGLLTFPKIEHYSKDYKTAIAQSSPEEQEQLKAEKENEELTHSYAGRLGKILEPLIKPLGFDWKIGIGLIGSFAAREVMVSTLGIVYGSGSESDENTQTLRESLHNERDPKTGQKRYPPLTAISILVFFVFACQCMSTLAITKRETNSWKWPAFMFCYMTALAYGSSYLVYQVGTYFTWGLQ